jgi:Restriction endonuclease NotI
MPKSAAAFQRVRYSIGEWYGQAFEQLAPEKRRQLAKVELEVDALTGTQCPFQHDSICNKKVGVCSLRLYEQTSKTPVVGSGHLITTCPSRFLEKDIIFGWVGETILGSSDPIMLGEIGFLNTTS